MKKRIAALVLAAAMVFSLAACGGNGGGRPDFAMAGAKDQSKLDDALAAFDQERMERALDLLVELSREEQILFFTCQSREESYVNT